jgi:hypothetical protein
MPRLLATALASLGRYRSFSLSYRSLLSDSLAQTLLRQASLYSHVGHSTVQAVDEVGDVTG